MLSDDDLLCLCEFAERNVGGFLLLEAVDLLELVFEIYCLREENDRLRAGRLRPETVFKIRDTLTDYREELRAIWEGQRDYLIEDVNEALADLDRAYPPEAV